MGRFNCKNFNCTFLNKNHFKINILKTKLIAVGIFGLVAHKEDTHTSVFRINYSDFFTIASYLFSST